MALFIDEKERLFFFLTLICCQVECLWRTVAGYIRSVFQKYTESERAVWTGPGEGHSARNKCPFSLLHHSAKNNFKPRKVGEHIDWFFQPLDQKKKKKFSLSKDTVISEFSPNNATERNDISVFIEGLVCCLFKSQKYIYIYINVITDINFQGCWLFKFILLDDLKF